jgi:hypothetical protein
MVFCTILFQTLAVAWGGGGLNVEQSEPEISVEQSESEIVIWNV